MKVELEEWRQLGMATLGADGRLILPSAPPAPGIYRFRLLGPGPSVYIGETDQLPRRFSQYRSPGPSQRTNLRMNERMRLNLGASREVAVDVAIHAWVQVGGAREPLDLNRKSHRMLAEEAALDDARASSLGTVENVGG